jgi:hypothetical protein
VWPGESVVLRCQDPRPLLEREREKKDAENGSLYSFCLPCNFCVGFIHCVILPTFL